jgi:hypothetical protein
LVRVPTLIYTGVRKGHLVTDNCLDEQFVSHLNVETL